MMMVAAMLAGPALAASHLPDEYRQVDLDFDQGGSRFQADLSSARGVQQRLNELGYEVGPLDGRWGPRTRAAVRRFLTDHGETPDEWISVERIEALTAAPSAASATAGGPVEAPGRVIETPTAPEAVPPALWRGRDVLGRPLSMLAGDRIATVSDLVLDPDGRIAAVIVTLVPGSGEAADQRLIGWEQIQPWLGRRAIVLGLDADAARAFRHAPAATLTPGQIRLSAVLDASAHLDRQPRGEIAEAVFRASGTLDHLEPRD